jgi:hypothetical protein
MQNIDNIYICTDQTCGTENRVIITVDDAMEHDGHKKMKISQIKDTLKTLKIDGSTIELEAIYD